MLKTRILVVAVLISAGAAIAESEGKVILMPSRHKTSTNEKMTEYLSESPNFNSGIAELGQEQEVESLYFYNSVDQNIFYLSNVFLYQAAIRFTPEDIFQYANYRISRVFFYSRRIPYAAGRVIIYDGGTPTSPGDTLVIKRYNFSYAGWSSIPIMTPTIKISGLNDIWVSVEVYDYPSYRVLGGDSGPAITTKGDWIYSTRLDTVWHELTEYGFDYNWNIGIVIEAPSSPLIPLPPADLTAYSDYTTPTEITLSWTDPTRYIGGNMLTDFHIEIWAIPGNSGMPVFIDTVPAGVETYTATGLTDGVFYKFFIRTVDVNDSMSVFETTGWYAGGSPYPAPPHNLSAILLDDSTVELRWTNPSTQSDGTPLDDLAGVNIYMDGSLLETYPTSEAGARVVHYVTVRPSVGHSFYLTAFDNETPQHESNPSMEVISGPHILGPDGYGYKLVDSDHYDGPEFTWVDATVGTPIPIQDNGHETINLPFPFPFYNQEITSLTVAFDGYLTSNDTTDYDNAPLPDNSKNNIIAPFWDNLAPGNDGRIYAYYDVNGTGAFVIEWHEVSHANSDGSYTFEVLLYPDGNIMFSYLSMNDSLNSSTIGIQNRDGGNNCHLQYAYNGDPIVVHDSLSILFPRPTYLHDVGIMPDGKEYFYLITGAPIIPKATVRNWGNNDETFNVISEIWTDNLLWADTQATTLGAGETDSLIFSVFIPSILGTHTLKIYTVLPEDENPANDTLYIRYYVGYGFDFEEDDGGFTPLPYLGWGWGRPIAGPPYAHSGIRVWGTALGSRYAANINWELYTPTLIAVGGDETIFTFWHWYDTQESIDGGNVSISLDGGSTWTVILPEGGYPGRVQALRGGGYTGHSNGWEQAIFYINNVPPGRPFIIRFRFASGDYYARYYGWYIDDVGVINASPIMEDEAYSDTASLKLIGSLLNPISSTTDIMFSVSKETDVKIEVYDVTGRKVLTLIDNRVEKGTHSVKFDVSMLTNGVYLLRMKAGEYSSTKKLVVVK